MSTHSMTDEELAAKLSAEYKKQHGIKEEVPIFAKARPMSPGDIMYRWAGHDVYWVHVVGQDPKFMEVLKGSQPLARDDREIEFFDDFNNVYVAEAEPKLGWMFYETPGASMKARDIYLD